MSAMDLESSRAVPLHELLRGFVGHRGGSLAGVARRIADLLLTWHRRARQRRQLACLSDRMLRDIGLSRADVWTESSKPFWRL